MTKAECRPRARPVGDELLAKPLGDELVVYDRERHEAHSLNATAKRLFELCDGSRSIEQLAELLRERDPRSSLEQARELVWIGLRSLDGARLLEPGEGLGKRTTSSRREALKGLVAAGLAPVVYTMIAPHPVAAQSGPVVCGQVCHQSQGIFCPPGCVCSKLTGKGVCVPA